MLKSLSAFDSVCAILREPGGTCPFSIPWPPINYTIVLASIPRDAHAYEYVCSSVCACVLMHVENRLAAGVFYSFLPYIWRESLLLNPGLVV